MINIFNMFKFLSFKSLWLCFTARIRGIITGIASNPKIFETGIQQTGTITFLRRNSAWWPTNQLIFKKHDELKCTLC